MSYSNKRFAAWAIILIITIGFMPVSSGLGLDSNRLATNCELALSDPVERDQISGFETSAFVKCRDFSVCAVHYGCAPLHSSSVQAVVHRTISIEDMIVPTRFFGIPERPPMA